MSPLIPKKKEKKSGKNDNSRVSLKKQPRKLVEHKTKLT